MKKIAAIIIYSLMAFAMNAIVPSEVHVYVNPGHGGHDSDDRNVTIAPYAQGDPEGFWESNSNLDKGLALRDLLLAKGCKVTMSRTTNTTEDDLGLETIGRLANNCGADIFFSIHSNATGTGSRVNFPLMLYRGYTGQPQIANSDKLASCLLPHLQENKSTVWTSAGSIYGDWSFYTSWGQQGLGVLRVTAIPAMLSEGEFHDYIPETYRLMNKDYKWLEAWHFEKAVEDYFGLDGDATGVIVGLVSDSRVMRTDGYIMFDRDKSAPINGATVTLTDAQGKVVGTYTTDQLYNGVYLFKNVMPGTYKVKVQADSHYDKVQEVTVTANAVTYNNMAIDKVRNTPPQVVTYSPVWKEGDAAVLCNTPIVFNFNWDMDTESTEKAFTITPAVSGKLTWEDSNYRMVFTPTDPYATNTHYTVTLAKSAMHGGGTPMNEDVTFGFTTTDRNYMEIIGQFPKEGDLMHYKGTYIELRCDKLIDASVLSKYISVTNSKGEAVTLYTRMMKYNKSTDTYGYVRMPFVKDLTIGENYTITFQKGIADKDGITLQNDAVAHFTAVDAGAAKDGTTLVEDFEDATKYTIDATRSNNYASSSVSSNTSNALFGTNCMALDYAFTGTEGGLITYTTSGASTVDFTSKDVIGAHVYGDLSSHSLYAVMTSESDIKYVKLCDLTFNGWQYVEVPMTNLEGGKTYRYTGIQLDQASTPMGVTGAVKLDDIWKVGDNTGIADATDGSVKVQYHRGDTYIVGSADAWIQGMELISSAGQTVAKVTGNVINVSGMDSGVYVVKVYVSGRTVVKKVMLSQR